MGLFKKKVDPITERERTLKAEIAALEGKIKKLNAGMAQTKNQPRLRSTALPHGQGVPVPAPPASRDPVFEEVDHKRVQAPVDQADPATHYNESGVRKFDLVEAWDRFMGHFRSRPSANQKLVSLLAAGNIQGLRPLRYEKRVARNRFIVLVVIFVFVLWGILAMFHGRGG
jgi:hypothetical protein